MRAKVHLLVDETVTREARALGVDMSRVAEAAIAEACRIERSRRWGDKNRGLLERYAREIEREGVGLGRFRTF